MALELALEMALEMALETANSLGPYISIHIYVTFIFLEFLLYKRKYFFNFYFWWFEK